MFIESRAIDDRATAGSFRTAHQRYASEVDTWFDGTPQSIDGRIARARRLIHMAKESVARRGVEADRLAAVASLESDIRALTALRHDLLTAGADREDNSPIAGVRIASPGDKHVNEMDDDERHEWAQWCKDHNMDKHAAGGMGVQFWPGDMDSYFDHVDDENSRERRLEQGIDDTVERPHKKARHDEDYTPEEIEEMEERGRRERGEYRMPEIEAIGDAFNDLMAHGDQIVQKYKNPPDFRREKFPTFRERMQDAGHSDEEIDDMIREHLASRRAAALSPADRKFVTLESGRFLAANTDTSDARELATRAMHFAQRVTSSYDVNRSSAVTTAFVQKVADGAYKRQVAEAQVRQVVRPQKTASTDNLPPEALFL